MKIKKRKGIKKVTLITIVIATLTIGGLWAWLYAYSQVSNNQGSSDLRTPGVDMKNNNPQATDAGTVPTDKQQAPNADTPQKPSLNQQTGKQTVEMTASASVIDNVVYLRGGINYPVSGGVCYATLTGPSGQKIRKDTALLHNPASTDCKTISISTNELSPGKWTYNLNYTSDSYEGTSSEIPFSI